jgi:hypothetical protein
MPGAMVLLKFKKAIKGFLFLRELRCPNKRSDRDSSKEKSILLDIAGWRRKWCEQ